MYILPFNFWYVINGEKRNGFKRSAKKLLGPVLESD